MAPEELPDDTALWPEDDLEFFHLPIGYSRDDLRRSYVRLLKRFRPEHQSEQFIALRQRYERLLHGPEPVVRFAPAARRQSQTEPVRTRKPVENPWQKAVAGDIAIARADLRRLIADEPEPVWFAQLYWLDSLFPDGTQPREWLYQGIRQAGWAEPLASLMFRELEVAPAVALEAGFEELRSAEDRGTAPRWYELRFRALATLGEYERIETDLEAAATGESSLGDDACFELHCRAYECVAWSGEANGEITGKWLPRLMERLNKFEFRRSREEGADRCEALGTLREGWDNAFLFSSRPVPFVFRIVAAFWLDGSVDGVSEWPRFLQGIEEDPFEWIELLAVVEKYARGSMRMLYRALQQQSAALDKSTGFRASEWLNREIMRLYKRMESIGFLEGDVSNDAWHAFRMGVVNACLRDRIPFEWAVHAIRTESRFEWLDASGYADYLESDLSALCVCQARRLAGIF